MNNKFPRLSEFLVPPKIWTRYDTIYVGFGQKVTLECISESHPTSVNYWLKDKEFIQGGSYETVSMNNVFKIVMRLVIRPMKAKDFGEYRCVAKNMLGEMEQTITLHREYIIITSNNKVVKTV